MELSNAQLLKTSRSEQPRAVRFSTELKSLIKLGADRHCISSDRYIREAVLSALISHGVLDGATA